jgi:thiamine kinase-like enzyme
MKNPPMIDFKYIMNILQLHKDQLISDIDILEVIESNTALIIKFKIIIKEEGHKDLKRQFFIKTIKYNPKTNAYDALSIKEVEFYKFIKNITDINLPIAQCFDAYISEDKDKYILLLKDLSNEFYPPKKVDITSENIWFSAACSLANLHTTFWNSTQIGSQQLPIDSMEEINSYIKNTYDSYEKFMKYVGDRFDAKTLTIFEHALRISVELETETYKRICNKDNITLIHGDSHIYNFMFPHNQSKSSIIIDFQFWGVGIGSRDLAHLTREAFPKTYGEEFHQLLMRKYHDTLLLNGIKGYSWDNCWNDYRKQVASMVLIPMFQYAFFNLKYEDWSNDISSLIFTYKLLHCEQLEV